MATDGRTGLSIRTATPDDALCIGVLGMQVFLDTYASDGIRPAIAREATSGFAIERIAAAIADAERVFLLAQRQGHLIGFAQLTRRASHELVAATDAAELDKLYVQERFTGTGVGGALLAEAEDHAARWGCTALWLTAWIHNTRALAFYRRRGYEERGSTLHVFEAESHENRLFVKALDRAATRSS